MTGTTHKVEIRVRYAEVDRHGALHRNVYAAYMEMGRTEMLRDAGLNYRDLETAGAFLVVAKLQLAIHEPARYDDLLRLETTLVRATSARIDHRYRLRREELVVAEGQTTLACVSRAGRIERMPEVLLKLLGVQ